MAGYALVIKPAERNRSMTKIAIYTRVSTSTQTTANQVRELQAWAERAGHEIVATYEDSAVSGSKGRDQRPGFDKMLKDAVRRRFALVAVWSTDRLGRSLVDLLAALQELRAAKVDMYIHSQSVDTSTPAGKMLFSVLGTIAEFERELIVARVNTGLARAKADGVRLGRPKIASTTEFAIRELRQAGTGIRAIARQLGCGVGTVQRVDRELKAEAQALAA